MNFSVTMRILSLKDGNVRLAGIADPRCPTERFSGLDLST